MKKSGEDNNIDILAKEYEEETTSTKGLGFEDRESSKVVIYISYNLTLQWIKGKSLHKCIRGEVGWTPPGKFS